MKRGAWTVFRFKEILGKKKGGQVGGGGGGGGGGGVGGGDTPMYTMKIALLILRESY